MYLFMGGVWTVNVFYLCIIQFFTKKFAFLSNKIKQLNARKETQINNLKLAREIGNLNAVQSELFEMNHFFKVRNLTL